MRSLRLLAALGSLMWLALGLQWFRGIRDVPVLEDLRKPGVPKPNPSLSVVVAARNEQRDVGESVESILPRTIRAGWRSWPSTTTLPIAPA